MAVTEEFVDGRIPTGEQENNQEDEGLNMLIIMQDRWKESGLI